MLPKNIRHCQRNRFMTDLSQDHKRYKRDQLQSQGKRAQGYRFQHRLVLTIFIYLKYLNGDSVQNTIMIMIIEDGICNTPPPRYSNYSKKGFFNYRMVCCISKNLRGDL